MKSRNGLRIAGFFCPACAASLPGARMPLYIFTSAFRRRRKQRCCMASIAFRMISSSPFRRAVEKVAL